MDSIRKRREALGINQTDLAERLNVSQSLINLWESGAAVPNAIELIKLAEVLKTSVDSLLYHGSGIIRKPEPADLFTDPTPIIRKRAPAGSPRGESPAPVKEPEPREKSSAPAEKAAAAGSPPKAADDDAKQYGQAASLTGRRVVSAKEQAPVRSVPIESHASIKKIRPIAAAPKSQAPEDAARFGAILREARKAKRMTLDDVGNILGVSHSILSMYETGKRTPKYKTLQKMGQLYGVDMDGLLGNPSPPGQTAPSHGGEDRKGEYYAALFGEGVPVTTAMWEEVKAYAKSIAEREARKETR